jgi:hypothetical protein
MLDETDLPVVVEGHFLVSFDCVQVVHVLRLDHGNGNALDAHSQTVLAVLLHLIQEGFKWENLKAPNNYFNPFDLIL